MATAALILVTAVWGITFVQVKDAVELYALFAATIDQDSADDARKAFRTLAASY